MKRLMTLSILFISIFTLAACGGNGDNDLQEGEVALTFWNIFTGPDGQVMRGMVDDFNDEYDGEIRVSTQTIPETDFYDVFNTSVPQGEGPDIAIMHMRRIAQYAELGMLNAFEDMIDADEMGENYLEAAWDGGSFEGIQYGIPLDVHPIGLYYNQDILDEAGIDVPTTYDELVSACEELEGVVDHCMPVSNTWPSQNLFISSLFQHGGADLDENHYPAFNTQEGYDALKVFHDMVYEDNITIPNVTVDEDLTLFRQGNAAFHINGIWMLNGIKESGVNFGTSSIDTLFGDEQPAVWADSHNFVMPYQPGMSEEKEEAIMTFIEYITANAMEWVEGGQFPADLSLLESEAFENLEYHSSFADVDAITFTTTSPYLEDGFEPIFLRVTQAMRNEDADIQELLDDAESEGIELVDEATGR